MPKNRKKSVILILGPNSQIGREFVKVCESSNNTKIIAHEGNICDTKSLITIILKENVTKIVNFAAIASVEDCETEPERCFAVNCDAVARILTFLHKMGSTIEFFNFGSTHEFDDSKKNLAYTQTKIRIRNIISKYRAKKVKCCQYTLGLCVTSKPSKNKAFLVSKIKKVSKLLFDISCGKEVEHTKFRNIEEKIRISSCEEMASTIFNTIHSELPVFDYYLDGAQISVQRVIKTVLKSNADISWFFDKDSFYAMSNKYKDPQRVIEIESLDSPDTNNKTPHFSNISCPESIINSIITTYSAQLLNMEKVRL